MNRTSVLCRIILTALAVTMFSCEEEDPIFVPPVDDTFDTIFADSTFQMCADCHSPGAPGFVEGTEGTQDWSSRDAAFASLQGSASGLVGNFADCNGVPLVGDSADTSLIIAVFDEDVRATFSVPEFPNCNEAAIADETLRVGTLDPTTLARLRDFIEEGGFD